MAVQARTDQDNRSFILSGDGFKETDAVFLQDAGRGAVALVFGTLVAKVASTGKYVPFTDETATDGTAIPAGIFIGNNITGAALVAGDVIDQVILVGGSVTIDVNQLTIENSKLLTTVIEATGGADNILIQTVGDYLVMRGIFPESTVAISSTENV